MKTDSEVPGVDEYIAGFPTEVREKLSDIRRTIREAVPEASEKISYGMPTYHLYENLVHFAGYKNHIGFYPTPDGITAFASELKEYKSAKGSVQFPLDAELPLALISRIAVYRKEEAVKKKKSRG